MEELIKLLQITDGFAGPKWDAVGPLFTLTCKSEFEACCKYHETWGMAWILTLPTLNFRFRKSNGQWELGNKDLQMHFVDITHDKVIAKAIGFLTETKLNFRSDIED